MKDDDPDDEVDELLYDLAERLEFGETIDEPASYCSEWLGRRVSGREADRLLRQAKQFAELWGLSMEISSLLKSGNEIRHPARYCGKALGRHVSREEANYVMESARDWVEISERHWNVGA